MNETKVSKGLSGVLADLCYCAFICIYIALIVRSASPGTWHAIVDWFRALWAWVVGWRDEWEWIQTWRAKWDAPDNDA